ncbi:MAG: endoribonuclease MazF [Terriglobales bacterium]
MVRARATPDAGDLVWLDFDPAAGREQAGRRPAIVLSPAAYNRKTSLAVVAPVTTHSKGYPFEVALPPNSKIRGVVLCDHLKSIDWQQRRAEYADTAPEQVMVEMREKLGVLLGVGDK